MGELFSALMSPSVPCQRHVQQSYSGRFLTCSFLILFTLSHADTVFLRNFN